MFQIIFFSHINHKIVMAVHVFSDLLIEFPSLFCLLDTGAECNIFTNIGWVWKPSTNSSRDQYPLESLSTLLNISSSSPLQRCESELVMEDKEVVGPPWHWCDKMFLRRVVDAVAIHLTTWLTSSRVIRPSPLRSYTLKDHLENLKNIRE